MKFTLTKVIIVIALFFSLDSYAQNTLTPEDLNILKGEWKGSLTYMDYSSGKPFTMPANVIVKEGKNENQLSLSISYPKETNANSKERITISKKGTYLNQHEVISKKRLSDGQVEIITEYSGKDDKKKALIKNTYILSENLFVIRKEVKFDGTEDWLVRNEYKYIR